MPMILKRTGRFSHASRSSEAISCRQGPHQLAHTLMMSGLPRKCDSGTDGPLRPFSRASRSTPPTGTSPGVAADAPLYAALAAAPTAVHKSAKIAVLIMYS
jgi:hypothetical protein